MKSGKKPPPDMVCNLQGRIRALGIIVRQKARMDAKDGVDFDKALARRSKEVEPVLKKLRARLAKVQRVSKTADTAPRNAQKRPKRSRGAKPREKGDDLLTVLDGL